MKLNSDRGKSHLGKIPNTGIFAGRKYKRVGLAVIHNQGHSLGIFFGKPPVSARLEVADLKQSCLPR